MKICKMHGKWYEVRGNISSETQGVFGGEILSAEIGDEVVPAMGDQIIRDLCDAGTHEIPAVLGGGEFEIRRNDFHGGW